MGISLNLDRFKRPILPDGDYVADNGVWLSCQGAAIRIVPGAEGISISVYRDGEEMEDSVVETWVTFQELGKV